MWKINQSVIPGRRKMTMNENFDTVYQLDGTIALNILDQDNTPNHSLPIDALWKLEVEWHLLKSDTSVNAPGSVGGMWYLTASLESIGEGYEGPIRISTGVDPTILEIGTADLDSHTSTDYCWKVTIDVTTVEMARLRSLPSPNTLIPNNYRVGILITFKNDIGVTQPMAASVESNLVTFYKPD
jgi:hypothetical protein